MENKFHLVYCAEKASEAEGPCKERWDQDIITAMGVGGGTGGPFSPSDLVHPCHLIDEEIKTQKVEAACYVRLSK